MFPKIKAEILLLYIMLTETSTVEVPVQTTKATSIQMR